MHDTGQQHRAEGPEDPTRAADALRKIPMLGGVNDEVLTELARRLDHAELDAGEWLFRAGDPSDSLYVVASGRLAVMGEDGELVREIGRGSAIGELGVIAGEPRSASVVALRDSALWQMRADSFWQLFDEEPTFQRSLLGTVSSQLRASRGVERDRRQRVLAIIPSSPDAPAPQVTDALEAALKTFGSVAVVRHTGDTDGTTRRDLADRYGPALDAAERDNDWVVLAGSHGETWRDFATTQADRVAIVIGEPKPPPWLSQPLTDPTDLILCVDPIDHVAWWDAVYPVSQVWAGREPSARSLAPLARRLAGRSVGLVLSGGGARGLAHMGVYAELVENGVEVERFGGTSAGALAGSMFAMGYQPDEVIAFARRYLVEAKALSDYTVPAVSLIRAGRLQKLGDDVYGDQLIEELPKEFYTISADMVTGGMVVHRRGHLWTAVRASISIPGVMPPVPNGEQLLVDGGLLNNIPADIMSTSPDGPIIIVDLRRRYEPSSGFAVLSLHPPAVVRQLLTGTTVALPSLQETVMRAVDLAAGNIEYETLPHVTTVIRPEVSHIGVLDLGQIDSAIAAGRDATRAVLDDHPELVG
jgi:NTE family protein